MEIHSEFLTYIITAKILSLKFQFNIATWLKCLNFAAKTLALRKRNCINAIYLCRILAFVVTSNQNHSKKHLFNNIKILNKFKLHSSKNRSGHLLFSWLKSHVFSGLRYYQILHLMLFKLEKRKLIIKIIFRWRFNRYYLMILIWCYYLVSRILCNTE